MFDEFVSERVGNYVYRLIDPRDGQTFYVGKGRGNRVFQHAKDDLVDDSAVDCKNEKRSRIRDIRASGLEVIHVIHRHSIPNEAVDEVEGALIDAYAGLSNIQGGYGSSIRGPMHANEVIEKYKARITEKRIGDRLLVINVNSWERESESKNLYDQVRFAWRVSLDKASQADYVVASIRGIIRGVFVPTDWLPAVTENFPDMEEGHSDRFGFVGYEAPEYVKNLYVGTRLPDEFRHYGNPVRYWYE